MDKRGAELTGVLNQIKTCNSFYIRLICDYLENAYEKCR